MNVIPSEARNDEEMAYEQFRGAEPIVASDGDVSTGDSPRRTRRRGATATQPSQRHDAKSRTQRTPWTRRAPRTTSVSILSQAAAVFLLTAPGRVGVQSIPKVVPNSFRARCGSSCRRGSSPSRPSRPWRSALAVRRDRKTNWRRACGSAPVASWFG